MTMLTPSSLLLLLLSLTVSTHALNVPPGCTYNLGDFECDFRTALPLNGLDFEPPPQRLRIVAVNGVLNASSFIDFASVNTTLFDTNFDATLVFKCSYDANLGSSGLLTFTDQSFLGMSFYKNVQIRDCEIEHLIDSSFQHLQTLNYLGIRGGYINILNRNAFRGLNIESDHSAVTPLGELAFVDVDLIPGGFPNGLFDPLENLTILTATHSKVAVLLDDVFKNLRSVHTLTLDDNLFAYMKQTVFRNMTALSRVSLRAIPWQCTCNNLWFVQSFADNSINLISEAVCNDPPDYNGVRASNYITEVCEDKKCEQGTIPSIDLGVVCLTYLQVVIYIAAFAAFLKLLAVCFVCWRTRRQALGSQNKKGLRLMTPRRPPPRQMAPMSHAQEPSASKQWMYGRGHGHPGANYSYA